MATESSSITAHNRQITAAHMSIAGAALIFLISFTVGIIADSITLLLDAAASLVILLVAFFVRTIIKKIDSPPDHMFNFGYAKYEPFTVALQNIAIIVTCLFALKVAIQDIIHPDEVTIYIIPVIASFVSGILALLLGFYMRDVAVRTNSRVLRTSGMYWFSDSMLSFAMCGGFLFGWLMRKEGYVNIAIYVDPVMAIILSLFLMKLPTKNITANLLELLDAVPPKEIRDLINKIAEKHKMHSFGINRMRTRKAGKKTFMDICFVVRDNLTMKEASAIAADFERDLAAELPHCDIVVHFKHSDKREA
ncbi:MAG: cation diffusion facilitator family transporter [Candidatus Omnitrophica bacterium]|nr:cation diffusion facilitator family transporter [Candidatus Omnitrophota bacterium]MBU4488851.1 cation diffusion facilitator family transporter [Candidatus Omnitrophota bacterium]